VRIKGHTDYKTNGPLIHDVFKLYRELAPIDKKKSKADPRKYAEGDLVIDWTYGLGDFWTVYRPKNLVTNDLYEEKTSPDFRISYTEPITDHTLERLGGRPRWSVYDPPYQLTGTATYDRYGVRRKLSVNDRIDMIRMGAFNIASVTDSILCIKLQDQTASNQPYRLHNLAEEVLPEGWVFDSEWSMPSNRVQPELGKSQRRPNNNRSVLRVYHRRGRAWKRDFWKPDEPKS
jgi:hypothetical protein